MTGIDKLIQLPVEISTLVLYHLQVAWLSMLLLVVCGSSRLSQMQKVLGIEGAAESMVEFLALLLDGQGAELSTPWPQKLC